MMHEGRQDHLGDYQVRSYRNVSAQYAKTCFVLVAVDGLRFLLGTQPRTQQKRREEKRREESEKKRALHGRTDRFSFSGGNG